MTELTQDDLLRFKAALSLMPKDATKEAADSILKRFLGKELFEESLEETGDFWWAWGGRALYYISGVLWNAYHKCTTSSNSIILDAHEHVFFDLIRH